MNDGGLLRRIQSIETRQQRQAVMRGDKEPEWVSTMTAMSNEDVDHVLRNLLIDGGPPEDPALAAIWQRAVDEGVDALETAEFDALHQWIVTS